MGTLTTRWELLVLQARGIGVTAFIIYRFHTFHEGKKHWDIAFFEQTMKVVTGKTLPRLLNTWRPPSRGWLRKATSSPVVSFRLTTLVRRFGLWFSLNSTPSILVALFCLIPSSTGMQFYICSAYYLLILYSFWNCTWGVKIEPYKYVNNNEKVCLWKCFNDRH